MRDGILGGLLATLLLMGLAGCGQIAVTVPGGCESHTDCSDGTSCRVGTCESNATCSYTLREGSCYVDGLCYLDGQSAPGDKCRVCDAKQSQNALLNVVCTTGTCAPSTGTCEGGVSWCESVCEAMQAGCPAAREGSLEDCVAGCEANATGACPDEWAAFKACVPADAAWSCDENGVLKPAEDLCAAELVALDACEAPPAEPCTPNPCTGDDYCVVAEGAVTCAEPCDVLCDAMKQACPDETHHEVCLQFCAEQKAGTCKPKWDALRACLTPDTEWHCIEDKPVPTELPCMNAFVAFIMCGSEGNDPCKPNPCAAGETCTVGKDGSAVCEAPVTWCEAFCEVTSGVCPALPGVDCVVACQEATASDCGAAYVEFQACLGDPVNGEWTCVGGQPEPVVGGACTAEHAAYKTCVVEAAGPCVPNPCPEGTICQESVDGSSVVCVADYCAEAPSYVEVFCDACSNPQAAGIYLESICPFQGFAYKGQTPDEYVCFLRGENWRIYQTGCGWEVQRKEELDDPFCPPGDDCVVWERKILLYAGQCAEMPESGYTVEGLTTDKTYNSFGDPQPGTSLKLNTCLQKPVD